MRGVSWLQASTITLAHPVAQTACLRGLMQDTTGSLSNPLFYHAYPGRLHVLCATQPGIVRMSLGECRFPDSSPVRPTSETEKSFKRYPALGLHFFLAVV
jgi:hypothetical protein